MPISLVELTIGMRRDRNTLLTAWGLNSSDNDDNLRCFYQTGNDIAVFITELNVGHPKSDRTYANWLEPDRCAWRCTNGTSMRTVSFSVRGAAVTSLREARSPTNKTLP